MLKYLYAQVIFSEIPCEITLGISITGCLIRCPSCHSRELWEDKGTYLTITEFDKLLEENKGVTTVLLLGGEHDIGYLDFLFQHVYGKIKTAWYCGLDFIPKGKEYILEHLNYLKLGHYDAELGGLASSTTNQRLYHIIHEGNSVKKEDITYQLQKKVQNDN